MNPVAGKVGRIFQVVAVLLLATAGLKAQEQFPKESSSAAQMRTLNNSVLQIHGRMQQSAGGDTAPIRNEAAVAIAQRSTALAKLIQEDPRAALSFAFSPELLADLAAKFPQSAGLLESHVSKQGPVEVWISDNSYFTNSKTSVLMKIGLQNLQLFFATGLPSKLQSGQVLQAAGVLLGTNLAVESHSLQSGVLSGASLSTVGSGTASLGTSAQTSALFSGAGNFLRERLFSISVLVLCIIGLSALGWVARVRRYAQIGKYAVCAIAAAILVFNPRFVSAQTSCSTTGVQKTAVLLVTFPGFTPPSTVTPQSVSNMFFGSTAPSVSDFWRETSYGQTTAAGDVFGWYTLTGSYTCATLYSMEQDAINAAAAHGANFQNYTRVFVIFPGVALQCGWAGLSTIGCSSTLSSPSGPFTASLSLIDAGATNLVETAAHEGGHALGLNHASTRGFGTEPLGPLGTAGTLTEYGDKFSTMACCDLAEYGAPHKAEELNWLRNGVNYQVVQGSGTYTLQPLEASAAGLQALKVQRGTGNNAWLWVEYRQPIGNYDPTSFPSPGFPLQPQPYSGALVHYEDSTTGLYTHLLNFTPTDSTFLSPALTAGQTWVDPYTNVSLSALSATSSGLTVSVNYGATPCTSSAPSINLSPLNPSIYPGQSASYTVSVTNNDSSACSSSTINLGSTEPSGWSTSLSSPSVTLSPGQSASVNMAKGAPSGTPAATYAVNLTASNNAASSTGTANATVITPPSLAVNLVLSATIFSRPSTVSITADVTSGGTAAAGASVTFTLVSPNGSTATQTVATSSNGLATWNYKLSSRSQVGLYSVSAQAALSSGSKKAAGTQAVGSNTVTFTVQ